MGEEQEGKGIRRRTFLKTVMGAAALGVGASLLPAGSRRAHSAPGEGLGPFDGCRIVVFGADALRIDSAESMRSQGAPGLSALNPPICSLSGGLSVTQPGWATIWTGMPSYWHNAVGNSEFSAMPGYMHIMSKLMYKYKQQDFFSVWITGKGKNIAGKIPQSPHYEIYRFITRDNYPGIYEGDQPRSNQEVFDLAGPALSEAITHQNFCCFIHFHDPDDTGHVERDHASYLQSAWDVDDKIWQLMQLLPSDVDIIYCSDHGFNFVSLGELGDGHSFAPWGMVATNFATNNLSCVSQDSIGRLIYSRAGGNPDYALTYNRENGSVGRYRMYGLDLA